MDTPNKPIGPGPKSRVCYLCGRLYMLHSYDIHLKQCKELWIARENQKDPRERKKMPEDPFANGGFPGNSSGGASGGGGDDAHIPTAAELEEMNNRANQIFNTETLSTCAFCGRTFLPEKLAIHNRSCTADNPARRVNDNVRKGNAVPNVTAPGGGAPTPNPSASVDFDSSPMKSKARPSTTSSSVGRVKSSQQASSDSVDLKLENGQLIGHMGGNAARELRKSHQSAPGSPMPQDIQGFTTKDEAIQYLSTRIDTLESTANDLIKSVDEMRQVIFRLRTLP